MAIYTPNTSLDSAVITDDNLSTSNLGGFIQPIYNEPPPHISGEVKIDGGDGLITLEEYLSNDNILRVPLSLGGYEGNNANEIGVNINGNRSGRKRNVVDSVVDRAAMQRQKRMIKNRESAARSRERKQAYTGELEALVTKLEADNAKLRMEKEELHKQRTRQLMENVVSVTEQKKPPKPLRKTKSLQW